MKRYNPRKGSGVSTPYRLSSQVKYGTVLSYTLVDNVLAMSWRCEKRQGEGGFLRVRATRGSHKFHAIDPRYISLIRNATIHLYTLVLHGRFVRENRDENLVHVS